MFSGRVSRGRYPSTTMRSKQWYTKATRLPNNFVNVSIGPPRSFSSHENDRAEDRWNQTNRSSLRKREQACDRTPEAHRSIGATRDLEAPECQVRGGFKISNLFG